MMYKFKSKKGGCDKENLQKNIQGDDLLKRDSEFLSIETELAITSNSELSVLNNSLRYPNKISCFTNLRYVGFPLADQSLDFIYAKNFISQINASKALPKPTQIIDSLISAEATQTSPITTTEDKKNGAPHDLAHGGEWSLIKVYRKKFPC